jgi:transcriptional regulator with XRE-family HTH domain
LKENLAILLGVAARSSKPVAPKVPAGFGRLLASEREKLGLTQMEVAKLAGYDSDLTVSRVEAGYKGASPKAAANIAAALRKAGANIPFLSLGDDDWRPPADGARVTPMADPTEEKIRNNLVRFREAVDLDQFEAADRAHIPHAELRRYELGEVSVSMARLVSLASVYGCKPGDFFEDKLPDFDRTKQPALHFGGPGRAIMTDAEREATELIAKAVTERFKKLKQRK